MCFLSLLLQFRFNYIQFFMDFFNPDQSSERRVIHTLISNLLILARISIHSNLFNHNSN